MKTQTTPVIVALFVFVVGCGIALYERAHLSAVQHAEKTERFERLAQRVIKQLTQRMQIYEYGLRGTRGAVMTAGSEGITRKKFRDYSESRELDREFPGARGFGFIRRVPVGMEATFLDKAHSEGKPALRIKQLLSNHEERLVIHYIEPEANNREAIGLDIASETNRRQAAMEALLSGKPTLTHPVTLVQASGKPRQGFLFLLPVYDPDKPLHTPEQRRQASYGLVYAPLLIEEVLADFNLARSDYSLSLYAVENTTEPTRFYTSTGADQAVLDGLIRRIRLPVYGRDWIIEVKARPEFISSLNHSDPNNIAAEITAASALLAMMFYLGLRNIQRSRQSALDHAKLAAIVESSTDGIIGKDLNGVVTSWNLAAETIFGYPANEAIGRKLSELIIPPDLEPEEHEILALISQGKSVPHHTAVRRRKDGNLIDVSITVSPIRARDGRVIGASKTVRDITEDNRKERRFRLAVDAAGVGVWVWHLQSKQFSWDQRMFELYGTPDSQQDGKLDYDVWKSHVHPDDIAKVEEALHRHLAGEGRYDAIFRIVQDDGAIRWIHAMATLECDHTGKALRMVGTNLDITEQTLAKARILELNANLEGQVAQRTAELQQAVAVAQRANEAKSEFLSNMSHEIRSPMNAILGFAYLLQKQPLPEESRRMVDTIHSAGHALLGIINDILDFSKIEAKRLDIEMTPFRLSDVLDNLASIMASAVGDKPVETVISPPPPGADFLQGDSMRLGQVLINLVSNAIKFTAEGEVVVKITRLDAAEHQARLRFSVRDTGIGIPKDKQEAIFMAFSQADTSTTRSYGGTGLGLTISSRLVALMGGTLQVSSEPGQGSEFSFEITLGLSDPDSNTVPEMAHQRVLIADDQPSARAMMAETVGSLGWHADTVESGEEVIERVCLANSPSYDILLLDWRMPHIDGLQAAQRIRDSWPHQTTPIIIMATAFDRDLLQHQPGSTLVDLVLTKPVTSSSLYNAVQHVKKRKGNAIVPVTPPNTTQRLTGIRVLVVDDSGINREVAKRILEGEGARVELAEDGRIALEVLNRRPTFFDVVLMDMQMPVMDGYAATRQLRETPGLAHIPVIALTAGAFAAQRTQAIEAGVNAFVAKPFEVDQLIQPILALAGSGGEHPAPPALPLSPLPQGESGAPPARVMNIAGALGTWKEPAAYGQFLRQFADTHEPTAGMMKEAAPEHAGQLAHKLRETAALLGLEQVSMLAAVIEERVNAGHEAAGFMVQLQAAMDAALDAINQFAPDDPASGGVESLALANPEALAPDFSRLLHALETDDVTLIKAVLSDLTGKLPEVYLAPLCIAVSNYDFRGAKTILSQIAGQLGIESRR